MKPKEQKLKKELARIRHERDKLQADLHNVIDTANLISLKAVQMRKELQEKNDLISGLLSDFHSAEKAIAELNGESDALVQELEQRIVSRDREIEGLKHRLGKVFGQLRAAQDRLRDIDTAGGS